MGEHKLVRSPSRRFTRENASPSFQPLTTVSANCLGYYTKKVTEQDWKSLECELLYITHLRELRFKISGLPYRETATLMVLNATPDLKINNQNSTDPLVILDLQNGDEFSFQIRGSGTFHMYLFSQTMQVKFQREFAIIDRNASRQIYASAIQKAKKKKLFPELITFSNDPSEEVQAVVLSKKGMFGFGHSEQIFFTYWNTIHDILRSKSCLNIQLFTGETARFVSRHSKFIARCVKHYRNRYRHTSKPPRPIVDAFQILHDFGF